MLPKLCGVRALKLPLQCLAFVHLDVPCGAAGPAACSTRMTSDTARRHGALYAVARAPAAGQYYCRSSTNRCLYSDTVGSSMPSSLRATPPRFCAS